MSHDEHGAPTPGTLLGTKYQVERVLGVGGMGVVLAARHVHLGHEVAIKLLHSRAQQDPENVQRFMREGQAVAALKSDHVVRVHDVEVFMPWGPALVLEFLDGEDLSAVVQRGRLPYWTAIAYVLQACQALDQAHRLGIVHRDLKPKNLFYVTRSDGTPCIKILDFGISQVKTEEHDLRLTTTGQVFGSPQYMAPEQMREARATDARTDIWAVGAILFELCAGHPAFQATSMTELTARILIDPPPSLRAEVPEVPEAVELAIQRCLQKDPTHRFGSIAELAHVLAPFAASASQANPGAAFTATGSFAHAHLGVTPLAAPAPPASESAPALSATRQEAYGASAASTASAASATYAPSTDVGMTTSATSLYTGRPTAPLGTTFSQASEVTIAPSAAQALSEVASATLAPSTTLPLQRKAFVASGIGIGVLIGVSGLVGYALMSDPDPPRPRAAAPPTVTVTSTATTSVTAATSPSPAAAPTAPASAPTAAPASSTVASTVASSRPTAAPEPSAVAVTAPPVKPAPNPPTSPPRPTRPPPSRPVVPLPITTSRN